MPSYNESSALRGVFVGLLLLFSLLLLVYGSIIHTTLQQLYGALMASNATWIRFVRTPIILSTDD